jgi:hypothetical protein
MLNGRLPIRWIGEDEEDSFDSHEPCWAIISFGMTDSILKSSISPR